jgi:hypothetical protein
MHFAVTWDYRCPFARNVHEHLAVALHAGAPWEVEPIPFSLLEVHVAEGEPSVFADPARRRDLLALGVGLLVRAEAPEAFWRVHLDLFAARHDHARDLADPGVVAAILDGAGLDSGDLLQRAQSDEIVGALAAAHHEAVERYRVFGVPTFVLDDGRAAFVRIMTRPGGDAAHARRTIERVLDTMLGMPELNELKFTTIPR